MIAYGEENQLNPGRNVSIANNTFIDDLAIGKGILNKTTTALPYTNNKEWGPTPDTGPLTESGTLRLSSRPQLDTTPMTFIAG